MSEQDSWGFAPPPFKADEALARLKRDLREAGLTERGGVFERRGMAIVRASVDGAALKVETVKQPARSPDWQVQTFKSSGELRDYVAALKKKLAGWSDRDD